MPNAGQSASATSLAPSTPLLIVTGIGQDYWLGLRNKYSRLPRGNGHDPTQLPVFARHSTSTTECLLPVDTSLTQQGADWRILASRTLFETKMPPVLEGDTKLKDWTTAMPGRDRIIRLKTVLHRSGLSRSTVYRKMQDGTFPPRIKVNINGIGWQASELNRWIFNPRSCPLSAAQSSAGLAADQSEQDYGRLPHRPNVHFDHRKTRLKRLENVRSSIRNNSASITSLTASRGDSQGRSGKPTN